VPRIVVRASSADDTAAGSSTSEGRNHSVSDQVSVGPCAHRPAHNAATVELLAVMAGLIVSTSPALGNRHHDPSRAGVLVRWWVTRVRPEGTGSTVPSHPPMANRVL
jgi:hypothetical protein